MKNKVLLLIAICLIAFIGAGTIYFVPNFQRGNEQQDEPEPQPEPQPEEPESYSNVTLILNFEIVGMEDVGVNIYYYTPIINKTETEGTYVLSRLSNYPFNSSFWMKFNILSYGGTPDYNLTFTLNPIKTMDNVTVELKPKGKVHSIVWGEEPVEVDNINGTILPIGGFGVEFYVTLEIENRLPTDTPHEIIYQVTIQGQEAY